MCKCRPCSCLCDTYKRRQAVAYARRRNSNFVASEQLQGSYCLSQQVGKGSEALQHLTKSRKKCQERDNPDQHKLFTGSSWIILESRVTWTILDLGLIVIYRRSSQISEII